MPARPTDLAIMPEYVPVVRPRPSSDENTGLVSQLNGFLEELKKQDSWIGPSALVLFALRYRMRVHMLLRDTVVDVIGWFCPWAK